MIPLIINKLNSSNTINNNINNTINNDDNSINNDDNSINNDDNSINNDDNSINNKLDNILNKYNIDNLINNFDIELEKNINIYENKEYNDNKKILKNFFTDFVTNHILDENNLYNLLYIINKIYNDTLDKYIKKNNLKNDDILFIFKGGNIFKLIAEKFWNELPNQAMYKLISEYKQYFKRSDLDFGIYINPNLNNSMKITDDISIISYKIQLIINNIIFNNKNLFLKWFKYNTSYQNSILQEEVNKLNKLDNKFKNIDFITNSTTYDNQDDTYIKFLLSDKDIIYIDDLDNNKTTNQVILNSSNNDTFMYTNINSALKIYTNKRTLEFNLTRTKINFNIYMYNNIDNTKLNKMSIGGELIDVSIGHDSASEKFYKSKNIYTDKIFITKNNELFDINIYSYKYLYLDLHFILFETVYLPWSDIKYKKRLYRIFYITFIDLFTTIKYNSLNNKHIRVIIQYYTLIYNMITKFNNDTFIKKNIEKISKLLSRSKFTELLGNFKCKKKCLLFDLLEKINIIIDKVLYPRNFIDKNIHNNIYINSKINNNRLLDTNELDNLLEFINGVKNNLNNLLIVNTYILNYCKKNIEFDFKNVDSSLLI